MKSLEKSIDAYLSNRTEYVIQITGNWGTGKTYYYKNILEEIISKKPTLTDAGKNYKPIYVSLFGIKSIEDIETKIVFDFFQSKYFKNYKSKQKGETEKVLAVTKGIMNIASRGILNFHKLGNVNDYLTDIKNIGKKALDTSELIVCFDDMERISSSLDIEDLTGYINSLVDLGIKILIISNDDELIKNHGIVYKNLKEKIIGISIEFHPDVQNTLRNVIDIRYTGSTVYQSFLFEIFPRLSDVIKGANHNFRHVIYALGLLNDCYSQLKNTILDPKHKISEKLTSELPNISILLLALAIEYRSSAIKSTELDEYNSIGSFGINWRNENEKELSSVEKLLEKYAIDVNDYHCYPSIFKFATGHEEFDPNFFIEEFKEMFHLDNGKTPIHYQLFTRLTINSFELTDKEYEEDTLTVIDYAKSGLYNPQDYFTVIYLAERYDNLLDLDLDKLEKDLEIGLQKAIDLVTENRESLFFSFKASGEQQKLSSLGNNIFRAGCDMIEKRNATKVKEKMDKIVELLLTKPFEFLVENDFDSNQYLLNYSLFDFIEPSEMFDKTKFMNGYNINQLGLILINRYKDKSILEKERSKFEEFSKLFSNYYDEILTTEAGKLRKFIIKKTAQSFSKILEKVLSSQEIANVSANE